LQCLHQFPKGFDARIGIPDRLFHGFHAVVQVIDRFPQLLVVVWGTAPHCGAEQDNRQTGKQFFHVVYV